MRIALMNHSGELGGGEWSMLRLAAALDPDRVRVTVIAGEDGPLVVRLREAGVETLVLPYGELARMHKEELAALAFARPKLYRLASRVIRDRYDFFRSRRIDVAHTNSLKAHLVSGVAARAARVPLLWHLRDHIAEPYLPTAAVRAVRVASRVLPQHVVAVSRSAARTIPRRDVTVLHQGVPLPELNGERTANGTLRVGLVGRISPWKGQDVFLEAAAQLVPRFPTAEFVLAGGALFGEDDFERRLRGRAEQEPLRGRVRFLGNCGDVGAVYRELDVAVHASTLPEPYGNVIVEAMAHRTAVVAAAAGGPLELVDDGRTGLLVRPGDPGELARAIARLLRDPDERSRLARAGREHVERHFSVERDARTIESIYRRLAACA
jgi:glycosyltransferase involved in cell wall biosynthesis